MKIAISSTGTTLDSEIDPRFGRANYFLIVDTDSNQILEVIDNSESQQAAHGAGINAATRVAESGAKVVLTGRVGPKAFAILNAANIKVVSEMEGTAGKALERFLSGKTSESSGPDGDAHFGSPSPKTGWQPGSGMGQGGMGQGGKGGRGRCQGKGKCRGGGQGR